MMFHKPTIGYDFHKPSSDQAADLLPEIVSGQSPSMPRPEQASEFLSTEAVVESKFQEVRQAWLAKSPSAFTKDVDARDLRQFMGSAGIAEGELRQIAEVKPVDIAAWRDALLTAGLANNSVARKMTSARAFFSFLQRYRWTGKNPAHSDFVTAPHVPRDGRTVGLAADACRRLFDAPSAEHPQGLRDRALLAVLAYSACRLGELIRLRVRDYRMWGAHRVLEIRGKGGKERRAPLHPEAVERVEERLEAACLRDDLPDPLFRPSMTPRDQGRDGFRSAMLSPDAVEEMARRYVLECGLDPAVTVHGLRVTALTTARERGCEILDLQDFAGHADPRTTLTYIRSRDRLGKSPAYVLRY